MNNKKTYSFKVGTVTLDEPYEDNYSYETAAWYTNYSLMPGTYDVYGTYENNPLYPQKKELSLFTEEIEGVITSENTQSLWGGVAIGSPQESREGKTISERMRVNPNDITKGKIKLDLDVPFLSIAKHEKGHLVVALNEDHPEWADVMRDRERHNFCEELKRDRFRHEAAQKNSLLTAEAIDHGIEIGSFRFEYIIDLDSHMRSKLGYGFEESGVPFSDASDRFKGRSGSVSVIVNDVMKELVQEYDLPQRPKRSAEPGTPGL